MTTLVKPLIGTLITSVHSVTVMASLLFRADDPHSVHIAFPSGARWPVARELLLRGVREPVGSEQGGVKVWPDADGVHVVLRSGLLRAHIAWEISLLVDALRATEAVVPLGTEHMDWDSELRLLGGAR